MASGRGRQAPGDAADEEVPGEVEEPQRGERAEGVGDGAAEPVGGEGEAAQGGEGAEGRGEGPVEGVVGEVEGVERGAGEGPRDLAVQAVAGEVERLEAAQRPDRGRERARERVGGEGEDAEVAEGGDGRGEGAGEAVAWGGGEGEGDDRAGGAAGDAWPAAVGGRGGGPGAEEPAWVRCHRRLEPEQGLPLAAGRCLSGRGEEEQEEELRAGDHGERRGDHGGGGRERVHGHARPRGRGHGRLLPLPVAVLPLPLLRGRLDHHHQRQHPRRRRFPHLRLVPASSGRPVPPHPQLRRQGRAAVPRRRRRHVRGAAVLLPRRRRRPRGTGPGGRPAEVEPDYRVLLLHLLHVVLAHRHRRLRPQAAAAQEEGIEKQRSEEGCRTCRGCWKQEAQGEEGAAGGADPGAAAAGFSVRQDRHRFRPARGARLHTLPARTGSGTELAVHATPAALCAARPGATGAERPPESRAVPGAARMHGPRRRRRQRQRRRRLVDGGGDGGGGGPGPGGGQGGDDARRPSSSGATGLATSLRYVHSAAGFRL